MSVRTKIRHIKTIRNKAPVRKEKTPWREVAKKEIGQFSEAGVMLRGCRYKKNITQAQLAKELGISQHHISEMENGKRTIGKDMAKRLATFLGTNYRVFL